MARRGRKKGADADTNDQSPGRPGELEFELRRGGLALYLGEDRSESSLLQLVPSDLATSLRYMLARLQQSEDVGERQSIAVTSGIAGEGVTVIARSLAALIANDLDRKVCLVETNWWADVGTHDDGSAGTRPGFADVLNGTRSLESALVPTSDPRLAVLPSGVLPLSVRSAVVGRSAFTDSLDLLTKWFDTVVLDVPPVLVASEATSIARHAEATVVVVRQGVTTEAQVKDALDELKGTNVLGVIVNRWSTRVPKRLRRFALKA